MSGRAQQQQQEDEEQGSERIESDAGVGELASGGPRDGSRGRHGTSGGMVRSGVPWAGGTDGSEGDGAFGGGGLGRAERGESPGGGDGSEWDGTVGGALSGAGRGGGPGGGADGSEWEGGVGGALCGAGRGEGPGGGADGSEWEGGVGGALGGAERGESPAGGGDESVARRIALDALSRAARTRGQLEALFQRKGIAPEAGAAVLDRFEEVGLIDDRDYAETFVESRHRVRGQGGRVLSMELRRRGVADDVIAEAVGGLDPEREFETACRIARSRYERMPAVPPEVKMRRLVGFLARKGYSGAIVTRVVRHVVDAADSSAAEALDEMGEDEMGEDEGGEL